MCNAWRPTPLCGCQVDPSAITADQRCYRRAQSVDIARECQKNVKFPHVGAEGVAGRQPRPNDPKGVNMKRAHRVMVLGGIVAASIGATQVAFGQGGGTSAPSALVTMVPCRLLDTRPAPDNVGPRATPLAADSVY